MLIVTICSPYLFTFFDSIFKSLFGNKPWPTLRILILVLIIETAHSFGISIFVFRVLPKLDVARAILMMNAVCTVPGMLKLLLSKNNVSTMKRLIIFVMDFFAVLMQCTVFGIVFASKFMSKSAAKHPSPVPPHSGDVDAGGASETLAPPSATDSVFDSLVGGDRVRRQISDYLLNQTVSALSTVATLNRTFHKRSLLASSAEFDNLFDNPSSGGSGGGGSNILNAGNVGVMGGKYNNSMNFNIEDILASFQIEWELPIALMLVSLAWWENFIDRDIKCGSYKLVNMKLLKENIIATRCKTNFISSMWKIIVTLVFAYIFYPGIFNTSKVFRTPDEPVENRFKFANDMGMWGFGGANNFMNPAAPNVPFGQLPPPPPPPMPLSKRSISDLFDINMNANETNKSLSATTMTTSSSHSSVNMNHNFTTVLMATAFLLNNQSEMTSNFSERWNHSNLMGAPLAYVANNNNIDRQVGLQAFTAAQMLLPSMSTIPNIINLKPPGNGPGGPGDFMGMPPDENQQHEVTFKDRWLTYLFPMILQVLSSGLCYYTGRLACKLCMQRIGFALPLTLVTPVTLSVALVICKWFPDSSVFQPDFVYWTCHEGYQTGSFKWQVICGLGLWWLSQLWIGGHVWFGKGQRLAFTER
jgi:hypothetical protein